MQQSAREALERLRQHISRGSKESSPYWRPAAGMYLGFMGLADIDADRDMVVRECLAAHPADDGEPVTAYDAVPALAGADATVSQVGGKVWVDVTVHIKTKGDLRRLVELAALGVVPPRPTEGG